MSRLLWVGHRPPLGEALPVDAVRSEAEALSRVRECPYRGVILAPEFSRPDLIGRLRRLLASAPQPVRIVSITRDGTDMRTLFRAGAADVWSESELDAAAVRTLVQDPAGRTGSVVAWTAPKGGTGCSTLLLHALRGQAGQALVIDLSPVSLHRFRHDITPLHYLQSLQPHLDHLGAEEVHSVAAAAPTGPHHIFLDPGAPLTDGELLHLLLPVLAVARGLWNLVVLEIPSARCHLARSLSLHLDRICWVTTPDVPCLQALHETRPGAGTWAGEGPAPQAVIANRCNGDGTVSPADLGHVAGLPVAARIPADYRTFDQARWERPQYPRALLRALDRLRYTLLVGW